MCGIAGILSLDGRPLQDGSEELEPMLSAMVHRGPDSTNIVADGMIVLGVNRLSILDHHSRADQPFSSVDKRFTIAFSGEIYNFRELRKDLVTQGYEFSTRCDTEVLLALYQQQGPGCLSSLRGMFAFAVWDRREQSLFLARDRFGEKPLVYYQDESVFVFASELPGLLASPRVKRQPDPAGIHMAMYYMHAVAPHSPYINVRKLEPAHYLQISQGKRSIRRYWQCTFNPEQQFEEKNECIQAIRDCLDDTVSLMCKCDTRVGALLSGGLDSSIVVASMSHEIHNLPTFRISSSQGHYNRQEKDAASDVVQRYATAHHEYAIHSADFLLLEDVIKHHGEPIATPVPIDAFVLARKIQPYVTVALCGAGADELFGGYRDNQVFHFLDLCFNNWKALENAGRKCTLSGDSKDELFAWDLYNKVGRDRPELIFPTLKFPDLFVLDKIYSPKMRHYVSQNDPVEIYVDEYQNSNADCLFNGFINQQLSCVSQYSVAEINDRMGMAHSVEIRSPFLDVRMAELACKIPPRFKVGASLKEKSSKNILREAMQDRLPASVVCAVKIPYGGTTPYDQWLKTTCSDFVEEKLRSEALADSGLYDMQAIEELYMLYQCGAAINRDVILGLVSTAIWMERFL